MTRTEGWLTLLVIAGIAVAAWHVYPLVSVVIAIGFVLALAGRFPLFGWLLLGFVSGLLGGGRGRRW